MKWLLDWIRRWRDWRCRKRGQRRWNRELEWHFGKSREACLDRWDDIYWDKKDDNR